MIHLALVQLAVSLYWLSFVGIGFGAWLGMNRTAMPVWVRRFSEFVGTLPIVAQGLLFFAMGFGLCVPIVLAGYAFGLPIWCVSLYYLGLLVAAAYFVWQGRSNVKAYLASIWHDIRQEPRTAILVFVVVLMAVCAVAVQFGGFLADGTDSFVHMAKINQLAYDHLTIADPYLRGVVESRYHVNILQVLYANVVSLSGLPVYEVWRTSYVSFVVIAFASIYLTTWYFVPKVWKRGWPYIIASIAMLLTISFWRTANYPNEVALVWIVLFVIGMLRWLRHKDAVLLVLATLLIALTHPIYSLVALSYMAFLALVLVVANWQQIKSFLREYYWPFLYCGVLLALPVLYSLTFPNRMTEASFNFVEPNKGLQLMHIGVLTVARPPILHAFSLNDILIALAGLVGLVWLILQATPRVKRIVIITSAVFFPLIAYNPIFIGVSSNLLPLWLIQRFGNFDRLTMITPVVGVLVLVGLVLGRRIAMRWRFIAVSLLALVVLSPIISVQVHTMYQQQRASQITLLRKLHELQASLDNQTVYADQALSFMVPAAAPTAQVIWLPETNATPTADMKLRKQCGAALQASLGQRQLQDAGVTRVLIGGWQQEERALALTKSYLRIIDGNELYTVFAVESSAVDASDDTVCTLPAGV